MREIERKFLVENNDWKLNINQSKEIKQAYINNMHGSKCSIRVRVEGEDANINIKSLELGTSRDEYEYTIPLQDALKMIEDFSLGSVEKTRHLVIHDGFTFEVDQFEKENDGLVVAEIELPSETTEFNKPTWLGQEVTNNKRYFNVNLKDNPYNKW